jgi:hypothetical protein
MKLHLHLSGQVVGGMTLFPWPDGDWNLSGYSDAAASAGNDLTVLAHMFCLPDRPHRSTDRSTAGQLSAIQAKLLPVQDASFIHAIVARCRCQFQ